MTAAAPLGRTLLQALDLLRHELALAMVIADTLLENESGFSPRLLDVVHSRLEHGHRHADLAPVIHRIKAAAINVQTIRTVSRAWPTDPKDLGARDAITSACLGLQEFADDLAVWRFEAKQGRTPDFVSSRARAFVPASASVRTLENL